MTDRPAPAVELRVFGQPAPQGSKRAVRMGAKVTMIEASKRVAPWRQDVSAAAQAFVQEREQTAIRVAEHESKVMAAGGPIIPAEKSAALAYAWEPLDGPLVASMVFTLPKPASAPKRRQTWPQSAPDLSKLLRSTEDALTTAGIWRDDARVVDYRRVAKVFPAEDDDALRSPGALIRIWTMAAWRGGT